MLQLPARLYSDLIGKPFAEGGRGPDAYDCVGLAIELQKRQGRTVPAYASTAEEFHRNFDEAMGVLGPCRKVEKPVVGGVVLLRMDVNERHIGTLVTPYKMIHTMKALKGGAAIERVLDPLWKRRIIGYYVVGGAV